MENLEEQFEKIQEQTAGEIPNPEVLEAQAELEVVRRELVEMRAREKLRELVHQGALERIAELEEQNAQLDAALKTSIELATKEPLTGLLNRRGFYERVSPVFQALVEAAKGLERRAGQRSDLAFIFLDIDKFKDVNDKYGQSAGDVAIKRVAEILEANLRDSDIVARWGGEEFLVAIVGHEPGARLKVAEKLRKAIAEDEFIYEGQQIQLSASFGTARYQNEQPDPDVSAEERVENVLDKVIHRAAVAMKEAKALGRNQVVVEEEMEKKPAL